MFYRKWRGCRLNYVLLARINPAGLAGFGVVPSNKRDLARLPLTAVLQIMFLLSADTMTCRSVQHGGVAAYCHNGAYPCVGIVVGIYS